jgi:hypothetical protein
MGDREISLFGGHIKFTLPERKAQIDPVTGLPIRQDKKLKVLTHDEQLRALQAATKDKTVKHNPPPVAKDRV